MGVGTAGNWITASLQITGSVVSGPHNAVLVGGDSSLSGLGEDQALGETSQDSEAYGAFGIVFRPRPPETVEGETLGTEAIGLRLPDGIVPVAWRDLRMHRAFPAPKPGTVALVGPGGGFLSFDDTEAKTTRQTLYCPYAFSGGVATKAHSITLDPDEETITVVHADGAAVILSSDGAIIKGPSGATRIELTDTGITIVGNVTVVGAVVAGVNPLAPAAVGVPVLCGPSPGVPSVSLMVATP